ncbi:Ldh family oxidoreductase [Pseudomaricurvus alkylphenolicus]|nr:Ldh family oxidoreductase [Pseudomaricurvus alkylphenolicus]
MMSETRTEDIGFLEFAIKRVWMAAGASAEHADTVAYAIGFAHRQGKLNQGLGVYEAIDIALQAGVLDITAEPELIDEGPSWAVFDGKQSSGYWTLMKMARTAIKKAKEHAISICYGGNHNDAGSFAAYAWLAHQEGMAAMTSNNSVPLAAPYGGMSNLLSCPPFDAIIPSGEQPPLWTSVKFAEFYDADIAEAMLHREKMKGRWLIDPASGKLTDDPTDYARPLEGYGRVMDYTCGGQIESPRTYALNLWNEGMTSVLNPIGVTAAQMPTIEDVEAGTMPSVGGSYFLCIDPSHFGPLNKVTERADDFVAAIKKVNPRPGHHVRVPGEGGYRNLQQDSTQVEVLENHWQPFFENIAGRYGLSEQKLREEFSKR